MPGCPLLRVKPVKIGEAAVVVDAPHDAPHVAAGHSEQDPRCSEKRHLGIIGNLREAAPVQLVPCNTLHPILLYDGTILLEFHSIAKGITNSPTNHAAKDLILGARCKFVVLSHD